MSILVKITMTLQRDTWIVICEREDDGESRKRLRSLEECFEYVRLHGQEEADDD